MCFGNSILIAKLEKNFPGNSWFPSSPWSLATFTRFLIQTFRKAWSTCTSKKICHSSFIFRIITHLLMDKRFPQLALKDIYKYNSRGLNGIGS